MTDPLSIAGTAAGLISLGIQVTQGLFDYYTAAKNQHSDVAHTIQKLDYLLEVLMLLQHQIAARKFRADEQDLLSKIDSSVAQCEEGIEELRNEANKFLQNSTDSFRAASRAAARRAAYPFRQSTLQKLDEDIDEIVVQLSLALQLLQQKDISHVRDDIDDAKELLSLIRTSQISSDIRNWLKAPDATINFNEACKKKHPRTGLWLVKGPSFNTWLHKPKSFLWLNGFAGCGKSVLCSTAVQYAFRHRRSNPQIGIAFFFFTFNDDGKRDASAMLQALVEQLSSQLHSNSALLRLYKHHRNSTPPDQALLDCLHELVRAFQDVYILLDALDESPREKDREDMLQVLNDIRTWSEPGLHLLVTSRDEVDIRNELDAKPEEEIIMKNGSIDEDIASFISQHLRDNRRLRKWKEHHKQIETVLTERAKGVFRWVECQFTALISCPQSEDLLDQLLESLPRTLDGTYERMLSNIPQSSHTYAKQMLTILCYAKRPLTISELIDGIAVELGVKPRYNAKRKLKDIDAVQEVCPCFTEVDVDPDTGDVTIRIAHFSVQEYLESDRICQHKGAAMFSVKKRDAHTQLACVCLTLLLEPRILRLGNPQEIKDRYPLIQYAAQNWPDHFRDSDRQSNLEDQVLQLFRNLDDSFKVWVAIWNVDSRTGKTSESTTPSPIYFASLLGFDSILHTLFCDNSLVLFPLSNTTTLNALLDAEAGEYGNALQAASAQGHEAVVQLLLEKGANVDQVAGSYYSTALQAASARGHEAIVQLLLEKGANVDQVAGRSDYGTALQAASARGHEAIVQLLLEKGANVDQVAGRSYYGTALQAASAQGHKAIVQLLLEKGAS